MFDRANLQDLVTSSVVAHDGTGEIHFSRVVPARELEGACNFIDLAELPPGSSIGEHQHAADEEEFYLVLGGAGTMRRDGEEFPVRAGDLIRNRPGGLHGLVNDGGEPLRLFVFELRVVS